MSIVIHAACKQIAYSGAKRAVLLEYADHANDDGLCWPSRSRIVYNTGLSESAVKQQTRELKEDGVIEVVAHHEGGRGRVPIYRVLPEKGPQKPPFKEWIEEVKGSQTSPLNEGVEEPKGSSGDPERGHTVSERGHSVTPESSRNRKPEPSVTRGSFANAPDPLGEAAKNGVPPSEPDEGKPPKPKDLKQYAVGELMERVNAKRAAGTVIHSPTDYEKSQFGRFFERGRKDGHEIDILLVAFDYQVAKAAGEIDGEPKAWCGYRTALDRVLEGWRPRGTQGGGRGGDGLHAAPDDEEHWRMVEENERLLREIMAQIPREQWPSVCR